MITFNFSDYRRWLIGAVCTFILVGVVGGAYYYYYSARYESHLREASYSYTQLINITENNTVEVVLDEAKNFLKKYHRTPYAALLQLQLAQQAIRLNQLQEAKDWLMAASNHAQDLNIRCIAKQRAARVLAAMGQPQEALALLEEITCKSYTASTKEIKGDILQILGEKEKALQAYYQAYEADPDLATLKPSLQMKINDLGHLSESLPKQS